MHISMTNKDLLLPVQSHWRMDRTKRECTCTKNGAPNIAQQIYKHFFKLSLHVTVTKIDLCLHDCVEKGFPLCLLNKVYLLYAFA